ncbi:hypothetical protein T260_04950 [Geobacillus thermopakistaniensis]|nr:hypothetical protein GA8_07870 [Geobacillus sp. A8]ESU73041.1 hypothetical protein T260_04950 [Geobacillus sp. MAS1]
MWNRSPDWRSSFSRQGKKKFSILGDKKGV